MNQTNTLSLLNQLRKRWESDGLNISHPATADQIASFIANNNAALPESLREYCMTVNGLAVNEIDFLARLWPLCEFRRITEFLKLYDQYSPAVDEAWKLGVPIHAPLSGREQYLRFPPERNTNNEIVAPARWSLPNADDYFIFGDYNIEGSFWAIRLRSGADDTVITVYNHSNVYIPVASSFDEFIGIYVNETPDVMG